MATDLATLKYEIAEAICGYQVHLHMRASQENLGSGRRYGVWKDGTQFGEPTTHALAQLRRRELTVDAILDTLERHGVNLPAAEPELA